MEYWITCLRLLFSNRGVQDIFGMKVVRHAHWGAGLDSSEDVEHAGGNLYFGYWVQFYLRLEVRGQEEPAVRSEFV